MPKPDLDQLAEKGRAAMARRAARPDPTAIVEEEQSLERLKEGHDRAIRSASSWGVIGAGYLYFRILGMMGCFVAAFFLNIILDVALPEAPRHALEPLVPALLGGYFALLVVIWIAAVPISRLGLRREQAWARSLPFALPDYDQMLAEDPWRDVLLKITFSGPVPEEKLLVDLLSTDGEVWTVSSSGQTFSAERPSPSHRQDENRALVRWFHKAVRATLLPLHQTYPIASIGIASGR